MKKNTRDTIRRPKDYERDPAWDADEHENEEGKPMPKAKTIPDARTDYEEEER